MTQSVKPLFGTYPYLRIAKKYGVDYGAVLAVAHAITYGDVVKSSLTDAEHLSDDLFMDIKDAALNFRDISLHGWDQS